MLRARKMINRALQFRLGLVTFSESTSSRTDCRQLGKVNLDILLVHNGRAISKHSDSMLVNEIIRDCMEDMLAEYSPNGKFIGIQNNIGMVASFNSYLDILDAIERYNNDNDTKKEISFDGGIYIQIVGDKGVYEKIDLGNRTELSISDIPNFIEDKEKCLEYINTQLNLIIAHDIFKDMNCRSKGQEIT